MELLENQLKEGHKALDVGSGSGILTTCFAHMVGPSGKVVGIDHIQQLVDWSISNVQKNHQDLLESGRVKLVVGDGRLGYPQDGPYHAIHVGAAAPELPQSVRFPGTQILREINFGCLDFDKFIKFFRAGKISKSMIWSLKDC